MDSPNYRDRELVWVQILYLFVIPTLLLYFGVIPPGLRFLMLASISLLLLGIIWHNKWTYEDMGITRDFMKDFVPYALFTLAGVGFLIWLAKIVPHDPFLNWWANRRFLLLFIPISVLQEVIFRGVLMRFLNHAFTNQIFIIILNASVFALIHVIYVHSVFVLPLTFIAGIGFAWMYSRYKNLILISASHTILNFVAMILGFFVIR